MVLGPVEHERRHRVRLEVARHVLIARLPVELSYTPQLARSLSASAYGSVMNATSSAVNAPRPAQSRWPYMSATYARRRSGVSSSASSPSGSVAWRMK